MLQKLLTTFLLLTMLSVAAIAQQGKLSGRVTEKGTNEPLIGVNVIIEGTNLGGSTDAKGDYVVIGVPPGTYTVKASYIGYQAQNISNIRISSGLTTTRDFVLEQTTINVEALEVVATRPIVQRNTTNTIRMTTAEDIANLPVRGVQNILALNAGVVQQNGTLYIRGGRADEVMYFVDGVSANNPMDNRESATVIQEAVEEIQMQAGGFTAEYGGSNSGVVRTNMKTGGSKLKMTMDYRTDDFAEAGEEFLGTTSRGYNNVVTTIGGPVNSKMRFFLVGQHNSQRNRTRQFINPFDFGGQPAFDFDDGLEGRAAGDTLPGAVAYKKNWLPNNGRNDQSLQGTLTYAMNNAIRFQFSGTYNQRAIDLDRNSFYDGFDDIFRETQREQQRKDGLAGLKMTHLVNPTTFYEINVNWTGSSLKNIDPFFGEDWQKYADRREWAAAGRDTSDWQGVFQQPLDYSIINNFTFNAPNQYINNYHRTSRNSLGASFAFSTQVNKNIELKVGANADRYTIRRFTVGNIANWLTASYGADGNSPDQFIDPNGVLSSEFLRKAALTDRGNITNYGWDYNGENKVDGGVVGARTPAYYSTYFQSKFEYRDLILNVGLRYERLDTKTFAPENLEDPDVELETGWVDEENFSPRKPYSFLMPRVNFAFPVTENSIFYAQYGKYVQRPELGSLYRSINSLRGYNPLNRTGRASHLSEPERTNQYELGIRQTLTADFAFTVTAYYKDSPNLWRYEFLYADGEGTEPEGTRLMQTTTNNDIATSKGLEMTLELRRTKRLAARLNYTLGSTKGTGSAPGSGSVVTAGVTTKYPSLLYNLDHNQAHRGTAMLDYRFARGDGPMEGFGINALLNFNSGHNYTQVAEPLNLGQASPFTVGVRATRDHRSRNPIEPLNSSTTPWNFNLDLNIDKMFYFSKFNVTVYSVIQNAMNLRNVLNVYQTTGTDDDDGWLKNPLAKQFLEIDGYEALYRTMNLENGYGWRYADGTELWGRPREIHFGIRFEFH